MRPPLRDRAADPYASEPDRTPLELRVDSFATGGAGVARAADGAVVFVTGALPGELVRVTITEVRRDFRRGHVMEIVEPAAGRIEAPCEFVADGCGGCGWQHLELPLQRASKREMVHSAWRRAWRGDAPDLPEVGLVELPEWGFRTTVRAGVGSDGSLGLRAERSHDVVPVGPCLVAHPQIEALLGTVRLPGATETTLRVGGASGERLVVVHHDRDAGVADQTGWVVPADVALVAGPSHASREGARRSAEPPRRWVTERVSGREWRVSAHSFFQSRADGAQSVVDVARSLLAGFVPEAGGRLVDLYAGVGVIGGSLVAGDAALAGDWRLTAVERSGPSTHDARRNLRGVADRVVFSPVEDWRAHRADVVVADPARAGLGRGGVATVAATRSPVLVLVSCDLAAWARDAVLLAEQHYHLDALSVIDMFPHTPHVEVVSRFVRRSRREARAARRAELAAAHVEADVLPDAGNPDAGTPDAGNPDSGNPDSRGPGSRGPGSRGPGSRGPEHVPVD